MSIFKAYDIRGIYPEELNEDAAYKIGKAFVEFLKCKNIAVARDARASSPKLFDALVKGIREQGCNVTDIGLCTTPMFYFVMGEHDYDGGIMITASHNPKQYNGLKLVRAKSVPISGDTGIKDIENLAAKNKFSKPAKKGMLSKKEYLAQYVEKVLGFGRSIKKLNVVIDAGNGMAPLTLKELLKKLPIKTTNLYFEIDCTFPNHEANPLKHETLDLLRKTVVEKKADLGVAFDGDADRVGFVDDKGNIIPCDIITALIAEEFLKQKPNEKILYEVRSSWVVKETIEKNKGIPVLWRSGHAIIKEKMLKDKILFGGEKSGHYFFRDYYFADDAVIAFLIVMRILSGRNKNLSELAKPLMKYYNSGEINFTVKNTDETINFVEQNFKDAKRIFHLDGLSVEYSDFWFNLRPSNTEPLIRLNLEAKTKEKMERMRDKIARLIKQEE